MGYYDKYLQIPEFQEVLEHVHEDVLADAGMVAERSGLSRAEVNKYFDAAQAYVSEEIDNGTVYDRAGVSAANQFVSALRAAFPV